MSSAADPMMVVRADGDALSVTAVHSHYSRFEIQSPLSQMLRKGRHLEQTSLTC